VVGVIVAGIGSIVLLTLTGERAAARDYLT
jgi:hypothetical protein